MNRNSIDQRWEILITKKIYTNNSIKIHEEGFNSSYTFIYLLNVGPRFNANQYLKNTNAHSMLLLKHCDKKIISKSNSKMKRSTDKKLFQCLNYEKTSWRYGNL